jgi:hypothetical protein
MKANATALLTAMRPSRYNNLRFRRHRLEVRTTGFQPVSRSSILRGATLAEVAELADAHG